MKRSLLDLLYVKPFRKRDIDVLTSHPNNFSYMAVLETRYRVTMHAACLITKLLCCSIMIQTVLSDTKWTRQVKTGKD